ncbi:MAG: flavodoxin-dependent (E)-4-hydroxy-3-methylbut-2-enyl-diphosphate synthase, partial [bacterium]
MMKRKTRRIMLGNVAIGGGAPVSVQSMTNTKTSDVEATIAQIDRLVAAGCEIVRVAVPDEAAAAALGDIKRRIDIPLIADIHFRHDFALAAIEAGVDGLRINPGNIGSAERVAEVAKAAKARGVPIRIGVNAGSLE